MNQKQLQEKEQEQLKRKDFTQCQHSSCFKYALQCGIRSFKYGGLIRLIISLIKLLLNIKKKKPLMTLIKQHFGLFNLNLPLAAFLSSFNIRLSHCLIKNYRKKQDWIGSFIAGCISGASIINQQGALIFLQKDNYHFIMMLMLSRIFDTLIKKLQMMSIITHHRLVYFLLFYICTFIIGYGYFFQPDILDPEMISSIDRMGAMGHNEKIWTYSSIAHNFKKFKQRGYRFDDNKWQKLLQKRYPFEQRKPKKL